MLIDTHVHLNMMVKTEFDSPLTEQNIISVEHIIQDAKKNTVDVLINVGTSIIESKNSITLAQHFSNVFAVIGIHPNDATEAWTKDIKELKTLLKNPKNKIVGIGECGMDFHYPEHNKQRQKDVFAAHIELALEHHLPLVVHTRDAHQETLSILDMYSNEKLNGIIHCFSEDRYFADHTINLGFVLGIGGPLTYPKNEYLRDIFKSVSLEKIVLETDAPFLPPQNIRGKQNSPAQIKTIAEFLAELRNEPFEKIAAVTTQTVKNIFNI